MSNFIRSESRAFFWRWREVLVTLVVFLWGLWLGLTSYGLIAGFGWVIAALGAVGLFAGWQRARFRIGDGGAGVVQVDERQIIYFGPHDGGAVSIEGLTRVELIPAESGTHHWLLVEPGQTPLSIPTDAEHSEDLFDAFSVLNGFATQKMLNALNARPTQPVVIWQKRTAYLH